MSAREVRFLVAAAGPKQYPSSLLPEVAFAGRSNVGKSSLINTLVGRKNMAHTSQAPGKTRFIHFYRVGQLFVLVDLPGYGYARVPQRIRRDWGPMVETYLRERKQLRLVVLLLDVRRTPAEMDLQLKEWLDARGMPWVAVATKVDKLSRVQRATQIACIARAMGLVPEEVLVFSSVTGEGKRELWRALVGALQKVGSRAQPYRQGHIK